jgi:hypothetical protein
LHDVRVTPVQLDELLALRSAVQDGEGSEAEAVQRLSRSPHGVWAALAPASQGLLARNSGERTLALAQSVVHQGVEGRAPGGVPRFLTAGCTEDATALLTHCGQWVQSPRPQDPGPAPTPRWMPQSGRLDAPVGKTVRRHRLGHVRHRVVCGTLKAVQPGLAACGWQSTTAFVARLNLSLRQPVAAIGRRVSTLCTGEAGVRQQLALYHVDSNFCFPHTRGRHPLPQAAPTHGTGSAQRWQPRTPAMAAGLTEHVWTLREVRLLRVPPWPQPAGV